MCGEEDEESARGVITHPSPPVLRHRQTKKKRMYRRRCTEDIDSSEAILGACKQRRGWEERGSVRGPESLSLNSSPCSLTGRDGGDDDGDGWNSAICDHGRRVEGR
ncbi:unnamed protein product [Lampetra planeri]